MRPADVAQLRSAVAEVRNVLDAIGAAANRGECSGEALAQVAAAVQQIEIGIDTVDAGDDMREITTREITGALSRIAARGVQIEVQGDAIAAAIGASMTDASALTATAERIMGAVERVLTIAGECAFEAGRIAGIAACRIASEGS